MENQKLGEAGRLDKFLDLYKQLEEALEEKYRGRKRRYTSAVFEFSKDDDSAPVREKLDACRELRNLLTHNPNLDGEPIAAPSPAMVRAMAEVLDFVKRPPLALEFATREDQVMKADLNQKVLRLMETMEKNGYSHIPVMREGKFYGVFSAGSIFRYQLHSGGRGIGPKTTLRDLGRDLEIGQHPENYAFVGKDATYLSVRKIFEKVQGKNKRISVVFITENGRPGERLLGMLTPWDVLGEPE